MARMDMGIAVDPVQQNQAKLSQGMLTTMGTACPDVFRHLLRKWLLRLTLPKTGVEVGGAPLSTATSEILVAVLF